MRGTRRHDMRSSSPTSLLPIVFFFMYALPLCQVFSEEVRSAEKDKKRLKIVVSIFKEEDSQFFNQVLTEGDIVVTHGAKLRLLTRIRGPKLMVIRQSISDIERELERLKDFPVDHIGYNPEQWKSSHTPQEEIENLVEAVRKVRTLANRKNAMLSFVTDYILLERYGEKIAPLVDQFGIQMQRYQREPMEVFRQEAVKKSAIIREGSEEVPIIFQLSLAPPKWKIIKKPNGEKKKVHLRNRDGTKVCEPLKAEVVLRQMEAIKDLADGIALLYTEGTRDEMKKLILRLRR